MAKGSHGVTILFAGFDPPSFDCGSAFDGFALVADNGVGRETLFDGGWVVRILRREIDVDRRR